jgi:hypothetical protein
VLALFGSLCLCGVDIAAARTGERWRLFITGPRCRRCCVLRAACCYCCVLLLMPRALCAGEDGDGAALVPRPPATPRPGEDGADAGKLAQESPAQPVGEVAGSESSERGTLAGGTVLQDMKQYNRDMKKVALLRNVPFCKGLSNETILTLAQKMKRVTVRTGRTSPGR